MSLFIKDVIKYKKRKRSNKSNESSEDDSIDPKTFVSYSCETEIQQICIRNFSNPLPIKKRPKYKNTTINSNRDEEKESASESINESKEKKSVLQCLPKYKSSGIYYSPNPIPIAPQAEYQVDDFRRHNLKIIGSVSNMRPVKSPIIIYSSELSEDE